MEIPNNYSYTYYSTDTLSLDVSNDSTCSTTQSIHMVTIPMCPDLLRYDQLGVADNLRGRVIRAFFWLMRAWPE